MIKSCKKRRNLAAAELLTFFFVTRVNAFYCFNFAAKISQLLYLKYEYMILDLPPFITASNKPL